MTHNSERSTSLQVGARAVVVTLLSMLAVNGTPAAYAANITVTSNSDAVAADGDCTLREAIINANDDMLTHADCLVAGSGDDFIDFDADYTITLDSQLPAVTTVITITGNGAANTIIQANALPVVAHYRVFAVRNTGDLTLNGLTVRNGWCAGFLCEEGSSHGAGIINNGGILSLIACTISGNVSGTAQGGGIFNADNGTLIVTDSTISGNSSFTNGGGISNTGNGTLTVTNSSISGNVASPDGFGAGIYNSGTATLTNSTISGNTESDGGGGIFNSGSLTVTNCTISENDVVGNDWGGGIFNLGPLTVINSTISGNTAVQGGGIFNTADLTVINSTLSGNMGRFAGGGIRNGGGTVTVINSTISGNTAIFAPDFGNGGGIHNEGTLTVTNSTISDNMATQGSGGIYNTGEGSTVALNNTLVAINDGADCSNVESAVLTAGADNIDSDGTCDGATTKTAAEINLGMLAPNGGPTMTMALLPGSMAINAGDNALALDDEGDPLTTDQRGMGFLRTVAGTVDVGAFEVQCDEGAVQACCIPSDLPGAPSCEMLEPGCCVERGGTPGGEDSECTEPRPCCDDATFGFICRLADPLCCELLTGGTPGELGTSCETEACCSDSDICFQTPPSCCARLERTALGAGTQCGSAVAGSDPGVRACCRSDGSCDNADIACCTAEGGTPGPEFSSCSASEACCLPSGLCGFLDPICCSAMGGTPQGLDTTCEPPMACCLPDGSCTDVSPICCTDMGGTTPGGAGGIDGILTCSESRACCMPDGSCTDLDPLCCIDAGGSPGESGTSCTAPQDCCFAEEDVCFQRDPVCCALEGGVVDTEAPIAVGGCPPMYITVECDQPVPPFDPQFTDNCDTNLTPAGITLTAIGDCPQERIIDRDAGATDSCGNSTLCLQVVNVVDSTAPVVTCPEVVTYTCLGADGIPSSDVEIPVSATDNCDTAVPFGVTFPEYFPPTCDEEGTPVVYSATDDCGNTGYCTTHVRVIGSLCCPSLLDTDLKLMVTDLDLRQDNDGPGNTKARFDIWNSNEVRFSGTERCIICWDETLISDYGPIANHLILENLQTDKGKARIQNEASTVCPESTDAALLGVAIQEMQFAGSLSVEMRSAVTLVGMGEQTARIQYDIIEEPEEANGGELRITNDELPNGGLAITQVPVVGTPRNPPLPRGDSGGSTLAGGVADNRASTTFKGSLVSWPVIEVKWDAYGTLIQDTFITVVNDNSGQVKIQFYQVNGDAPLDPVIDQNSMELIERGHPGWNWSDYQITLTGDESAYWSVASGLPKGVSPISVLDSGNPNGRPDLDPSNPGGRVIRGFLVGWAVNDDGQEIRWNHLTGHAISIRYDQGTAFDYNPWNFRVVSGVAEGAQSDGDPGNLNLDGVEYDYAPETLLFDFFAAGSNALSHPDAVNFNHDD